MRHQILRLMVVPIQIDYDSYNITTDGYYGKIDSYDH